MSNNVIDFTAKLLEKQDQIDKAATDQFEDLSDICQDVANECLNSLREDFDLPIDEIEASPEIIFFFESLKGLIFKSMGQWHPFQEFAQDFFDMWNIKVVEKENGNYEFKMEGLDSESAPPANDG